MASTGPYASHLYLHASTSSLKFFTFWMLFPIPKQHCQCTEGTHCERSHGGWNPTRCLIIEPGAMTEVDGLRTDMLKGWQFLIVHWVDLRVWSKWQREVKWQLMRFTCRMSVMCYVSVHCKAVEGRPIQQSVPSTLHCRSCRAEKTKWYAITNLTLLVYNSHRYVILECGPSEVKWVGFNGPTKHIIGHFVDGFCGSNDPTNSVKALKEV